MTLFRLIQEGITNIAKHAHASSATIELTISNDRVTLTKSSPPELLLQAIYEVYAGRIAFKRRHRQNA